MKPASSPTITPLKITSADRRKAQVCIHCPVCRHARRRQKGLAFEFVRRMEGRICPFCRAYEKVYGRKPHQPFAEGTAAPPTGEAQAPHRPDPR
jgi:hypothetical protein